MKTQPLIFSFAFTLLGFFSGFSVVFADGFQQRLNTYLEEEKALKDKIEMRRVNKLVTSLAEQGDAKSQFKMGMIYKLGQGVQQDYKEAAKWYRLSAEQGDADAQYNLASMYDEGHGVPQDYKEAVKWYRLSAEQGNALGQYNLGNMYAKGTGVLQDYVSAHMWWNICGVDGDKKCVKFRDTAEMKMTPSQIEKAQDMARNWKPKK